MRAPFKYVLIIICVVWQTSYAQNRGLNWTADGNAYYIFKDESIVRSDPKNDAQTVIIAKEQLTPAGSTTALKVQSFDYSADRNKILLFANTAKVWRYTEDIDSRMMAAAA